MTSKNSFFNLLKEDFRRRLWTFILSSLVFFATFFVAFTMILQEYVSRFNEISARYTETEIVKIISDNLCNDFYGVFPWFMLVAVVGAIICGMNGFAYLHSKKQMDFYHSLPVKREVIFAVRFVNGIMIYAIPYLIGLLFSFLLCAVYGVMTSDLFFCGTFCFVLHLMGYIVIYLGTIIAMLLTGKTVIAFFGNCVLNLYVPAICALALALKDSFFITSYGNTEELRMAMEATRWLSPVSFYFNLVYSVESGIKAFWLEFLSFLLLTAVLIVLAVWLYKKRASEKTDIAMSFKVTEPIIRMMLAIPVGVMAGFCFYHLQYSNGTYTAMVWLIFGSLFGAFLCHGIIESLYNGDIRKCLSHKLQMLAAMAVPVVILLSFFYDIFGYDAYVPKKQEIANMAIISDSMRFGGSYYDEDGWVSAQQYGLDNMEVTDIDAMYELAELLAEEAAENRTSGFFSYRYVWEYADGAEKVLNTHFLVRYKLKDGSEVIRQYNYNYYAVLDLLERIYSDDEFKTAVHPVFGLLENGIVPTRIESYAPTTGITIAIKNNCDSILQTYAEEVKKLSFRELKETAAIGELIVHFKVEAKNAYEDNTCLLVYPSMTRTLALLKQNGYTMKGVQDAENINRIQVHYSGTLNEIKRQLGMDVPEDMDAKYADMEEDVAGGVVYDKYGETQVVTPEEYRDITVEFTNPAEIAEIQKGLLCSDYVAEFGPWPERNTFIIASVFFEVGTGAAYEEGLVSWSERFRFAEDKVPQFVIDRILEELGAEQLR